MNATDSKPGAVKKLFRGLWCTLKVLLLLIVLLLIFVLAGGLGPTVKYVGVPVANALGIPLAIEKCVILPLGGYVRLEGVQVANPSAFAEGNPKVYAETPLARIGTFEADVAMRSLLSDEICVDTIRLTGVRALYAFDLDTTNVDALLAQAGLDKTAPAAGPEAEPEAPAAEPAAEPSGEPSPWTQKSLRLAYVNIADNSVTIRKFVSLPIPLPPLTLHDVDSETLVEKVTNLLAPVLKTIKTGSEGLGSGVKALGSGAATLGEGARNISSETVDSAREALGESAKAIEESAKAIGDDLRTLFRKK